MSMRVLGLAMSMALACGVFGQSATVFSYPSGSPVDCTIPTGFSTEALCSVSHQLPLGSVLPAWETSWKDRNLGGGMRLLSGANAWHSYSTISPFSTNDKHVIANLGAAGMTVYDRETRAVLYANRPGSLHGVYWDAWSDGVYYFLSGAKLMKHTLATAVTEVVIDYAVTHRFTSINAGGTGDTTIDNWLAFVAPAEHRICAVDISNIKTYCADYMAADPGNRVGWSSIDYPLMSKGVDSASGKRYVLLFAKPAMGVYSVDLGAGVLRFEYRGPEMGLDTQMGSGKPGNRDGVCDPGEVCLSTAHADVMQDSDGRQYLVRAEDITSPCSRVLSLNDLSKGVRMNTPAAQGGGRTDMFMMARCGGGYAWPSLHVGCAKKAPYCAISTDNPGALRNPEDLTTPLARAPFATEIFIVRSKGLEVQRLAQSQSVKFTSDSYWSTPRAAISPSAKHVLFNSNFGIPGQEKAVLLDATDSPDAVVLRTFAVPASIAAGGSAMGQVVISSPAPAGGVPVTLTSSNPALTVSPSILIGEGTTGISFTVRAAAGVLSPTSATITASVVGTTARAVVTVFPTVIAGLAFNHTSVVGGNPVVGTVTISSEAVGTGGIIVTLSADSPAVKSPSSVVLPKGALTVSFEVATMPVATPTVVNVAARLSTGSVQSAAVQLLPK
jgi:hypothetical protein